MIDLGAPLCDLHDESGDDGFARRPWVCPTETGQVVAHLRDNPASNTGLRMILHFSQRWCSELEDSRSSLPYASKVQGWRPKGMATASRYQRDRASL